MEIPLWGLITLIIGFIGKIIHDHYMQRQIERDLLHFKAKHKDEMTEFKYRYEKDLTERNHAKDKALSDLKNQLERCINDLKSNIEKDQNSITNGFFTQHTQLRDSHEGFKSQVLGDIKMIREEQISEQNELRKVLEGLEKANTKLSVAIEYMSKDLELVRKQK